MKGFLCFFIVPAALVFAFEGKPRSMPTESLDLDIKGPYVKMPRTELRFLPSAENIDLDFKGPYIKMPTPNGPTRHMMEDRMMVSTVQSM